MPESRLRTIVNGIFFSLVSYGIQLYGSVSGLDLYSEGSGRYQALTRNDSHSIQVIMNSVLRSLTKLPKETPIPTLLKSSGFLSFHQMCAFYTLSLAKKIIIAREPVHIFQELEKSQPITSRPRRNYSTTNTHFNLSISRESFIYQATKLYSKLPTEISTVQEITTFKKKVRKWVELNIPVYM